MKRLRTYDVAFSGLKLGKHLFEFPITQEFFELFSAQPDFENLKGTAYLTLEKNTTFMEAELSVKAQADFICDHSGETFTDKSLHHQLKIILKFGEEFNDEDDEIWVIPFNEHQINMGQLIYESLMLALPMKRIKPEYKNQEEDLFIEDTSEKPEIDPRWDALKNLKNK